jgi:hypothetical protein
MAHKRCTACGVTFPIINFQLLGGQGVTVYSICELLKKLYYFSKMFCIMFQAVLEKQSYMLIGRHDIEKLMRLDPASSCLPNPLGQSNMDNNVSDAESIEVELELSDLLLALRPIKQVLLWAINLCSYFGLLIFLQ